MHDRADMGERVLSRWRRRLGEKDSSEYSSKHVRRALKAAHVLSNTRWKSVIVELWGKEREHGWAEAVYVQGWLPHKGDEKNTV